MSEPRRLLEEGGSDEELALLSSARFDAPAPHARRRALLALGLGSAVGASATVTTTAAATATVTTAAGSTAVTAGGLALVKWVGIGIVGGLLTVGTFEVAQPVEPRSPPPATRSLGAPPSAPAGAGAREANAGTGRPGEVAPLAAVEAPAAPVAVEEPRREARAAPKPAAREEAPTLADEVAGLDKAREALARGDAPRALAELERHDRKFAAGSLGPEAMVLRIEATAARGDKAGAVRLGNEFLAAHPRSPHAARVRSVIAQSSGP